MPTILDCPKCSRKLRVPEELHGTRVQCPSCGTAFEAAASPPPLPAEPPSLPPTAPTIEPNREVKPQPAQDESSPPGPPRREPRPPPRDQFEDEDDDEDRPWERSRSPVRRDCEPHRGGAVLALGITSIVLAFTVFLGVVGLALGIAAWIMGQRDLAKIRQRVMDPQGQGTTQAGWICGIIGTIFSSLATLGCIAYIAFFVFMINMMSQMTGMKTMPPTQMPPQPVKKVPGMFLPLRPLDYLPSVRS
jgi:hypothetical protein